MRAAVGDAERRMVLTGDNPGESYAVLEMVAERYELAQVIPTSPQKLLEKRWMDRPLCLRLHQKCGGKTCVF